MKKRLIALLMAFFGVSGLSANSAWQEDPTESVKGIHILTDYGSQHQYLGENLDIVHVLSELRKLPWTTEFIQFVVVTEPGVSMEVGGSLNGIDGLSGVYRNRHTGTQAVTTNAPESVNEMEEILKSFLGGNEKWKSLFEF
jgi:hypothetical protein